jgi:hypothetical protein
MDEYGDVEDIDIQEIEYEEYEENLDEIEESDEDKVEDDFEAEYTVDTLPDNVIKLDKQDKNYRIVRVVRDENRITSDVIQLPELVEAVGIRASAIENGCVVLTDVEGLANPIDMAKLEFYRRMSPLILQRVLKKTEYYLIVEFWRVREMQFPVTNRKLPMTDKQIAEFTK